MNEIMTNATVTVRLTPATRRQLARLAARTGRRRTVLAGEAVSAYVAQELAVIEGVSQGLADRSAGRVVPHGEAMRRIRRAIEDAADDR